MKVLALSSSRVGNSGYLEQAIPLIEDFLAKNTLTIAFIPFASVERTFDEFGAMVSNALSSTAYQIKTIKKKHDRSLVEDCDAIMVGGGNTFKLLHDIYENDLFELIHAKVRSGTPYIGWSAGANLTGKTIRTTNDMPIIQPKSFKAFGFFPFQINPHYFNLNLEGFHGETRDQRLSEFLHLHHADKIVGLPEGTALQRTPEQFQLIGFQPGVLFTMDQGKVVKTPVLPQQDLSFLLV